jgi:hypothetical protein
VVLRPYSGARYFLGLLQGVLLLGALVALITAIAAGAQWLEKSLEGSSRPERRIERAHPSMRVEGMRPKTPTTSATTSATLTSSGVSASSRAGAGALPGSGGAPVLSVVAGILLVGAGIVGARRSRRTS